MRASAIRVRIKSTKQIVDVDASDLNQYGELSLRVEKEYNGMKFYDTKLLKPSQFEIIPEKDFYDFRNNTAKDILLKLMDKDQVYDNEDFLIDEAIRITDKLIAKL